MGAYSPAPVATDDIISQAEKQIIQPVLKGMIKEGCPYKGVLYAGLMITSEGPKVVEFNCRLGDPEAQVILPVYQGDFLDLLLTSLKDLSEYQTVESSRCAAIVVLAAQGYPGTYDKHKEVLGLESSLPSNVHVIHAGTKAEDGKIYSAGGRVIGLIGEGENLPEAIKTVYTAVDCVTFENAHYRTDIGKKGLERLEKR